ncbi:hypothetical protein [Nonomuraea sp. NPDC049400]|uniref:hypothetical protein n=1 Tax=Nonomuraea sp. NPDC049400 TaxID=3364352 RepID=UPI00378AF339
MDEAVAAALTSASWIMAAIARERELESLSRPWLRPVGRPEADDARLRRTAGKVRRDLVDRLSRERGAARRAAVICLAQPSLNGYVRELDLALSGSDGWTVVEVAALFTAGHRVCRRREIPGDRRHRAHPDPRRNEPWLGSLLGGHA